MMPRLSFFFLLVAAGVAMPGHAEQVFKRVDEQGNVTYESRPGYGDGSVEARDIDGGLGPSEYAIAMDQATLYNPVILFSIAKCKPCDQAREQLNKRGIPFKEKDPTTDKALYKEFQALGGGNVVPVIKIGESAVTEYTAQALTDALDAAGYPKPQKEEGAEESGEPAEGAEAIETGATDEAGEVPPDEGR